MEIVKLMISTNPEAGKAMLNNSFNPIVWASDDLMTVAHYYEGCVLEIEIKLLESLKKYYTRCYNVESDYTWGTAEMAYPAGANWYSFSKDYITENLVGIKEIFPDLSEYQEEEE